MDGLGRLVGHTRVRAQLARHTGSFALLAPTGVGRRGIVAEWLGERAWTAFTDPDDAETRPGLVHVIDAAQVRTWTPLLRCLEEARFDVVVLAEQPPPTPVLSRLPVFRAGLLSTADVTRVLAEQHPTVRPRPVVAELAAGSLAGLDVLLATVAALEHVQDAVAELKTSRKVDPLVQHRALRALCRAVLGLCTLSLSDQVRATLTRTVATELLARPEPASTAQARNDLALVWAYLRADRG